MNVEVELISSLAKPPTQAHEGDAGYDVYSQENATIAPNNTHFFKLGFKLRFPKTLVCQVWDKSGLALKNGITVLGGVIDSSYRGEVGVILYNAGDQPVTFNQGDKLAQLVFTEIQTPRVETVDELDQTTRGDGGFGSTGK
jgi:dUTP pyrophosphatase